MDTGTILFVESTSSGKIKQETFTITQEQTDELLETIKDIANQIRSLKFWNQHCENQDCSYCRLRDMMSN